MTTASAKPHMAPTRTTVHAWYRTVSPPTRIPAPAAAPASSQVYLSANRPPALRRPSHRKIAATTGAITAATRMFITKRLRIAMKLSIPASGSPWRVARPGAPREGAADPRRQPNVVGHAPSADRPATRRAAGPADSQIAAGSGAKRAIDILIGGLAPAREKLVRLIYFQNWTKCRSQVLPNQYWGGCRTRTDDLALTGQGTTSAEGPLRFV